MRTLPPLPLLPFALAGAAALLAGCGTTAPKPPVSAVEVGEFRAGSGILNGYLPRADLPDSLALVAAPPAEGSAALAADVATTRQLTALASGPRGVLARKDANLNFPAAASVFDCALGLRVSEAGTPHLNMLLRRTLTDAGLATNKAKDHYTRTRPFVALNLPSCTPDEEAKLSKDGSFPSGHSALGWAWALVLAEMAPDRADPILRRGLAYGESRAVCGVHYVSDVEAGRIVGAAMVARLKADPGFQADFARAKEEFDAARAASKEATSACPAALMQPLM